MVKFYYIKSRDGKRAYQKALKRAPGAFKENGAFKNPLKNC